MGSIGDQLLTQSGLEIQTHLSAPLETPNLHTCS